MQGAKRKITQAILYEFVALFCIAPVITLVYQEGLAHSAALSLMISLIAMAWNMGFNTLFEAWERRQQSRRRTVWRRVAHAIGFEGGLTILLLPLISLWLKISWLAALGTNLGLFVFFFFYAYAFQWGFDKVFGVPTAAIDPEDDRTCI